MNEKVWYLYHSGFAVQTAGHFLIFDYWRDKPKGAGLESGVIEPALIQDRDVVVFVSHKHGDHYNRKIHQWKGIIPKLRIILSDDIRPTDGAIMIGPGKTLTQPDITVKTLTSNDEGVAFIVDIDGLRIYHAGDLNWWHWEGEPDDYNDGMAAGYKSQIDLLANKPIDIAFVPVDPRLEEQYAWGIDYLMKTAEVRNAIPMHFGNDISIIKRLSEDPISLDYRDRIADFAKRGEIVLKNK
jgi:L-ascorbate metabolism protein UlaG (beta-lactamase superfamily)